MMFLNKSWMKPSLLSLMGVFIWGGALTYAIDGAAQAQQSPSVTIGKKALAAGYKSMFTCSAIFNGGKTKDQIAAHELTNAYPDFEAAFAAVEVAEIDRAQKLVSVAFAENTLPRLSVWREHLGCTALPQGADRSFIAHLPNIHLDAPEINPADQLWPIGDKLPNAPLPNSVDTDQLDAAVKGAFAGEFGGVTSAVVVIKNNRLITEHYLEGYDIYTSQRTWSVAKSIGVSVIGAAAQKGILDVSEKAALSEWARPRDPRGEITIENLLHMGSGLNSDPAGNRTDQIYFGGGLAAQYATKNPLEVPPATRWRYANNDTMLAVKALRVRMDNDQDFWEFPFKSLLHKIGMYHTVPEIDWGGDFILSSQVWTTARDLARLGQLYLNDGIWQGERILPQGWSDYVSAPAPAQPLNRQGEAASTPGRGYGAQFWRYENYPGVPEGTYAALGNRGQFIIIVPSENVVIVRRGYDYQGERFDGPAFTRRILSAFE